MKLHHSGSRLSLTFKKYYISTLQPSHNRQPAPRWRPGEGHDLLVVKAGQLAKRKRRVDGNCPEIGDSGRVGDDTRQRVSVGSPRKWTSHGGDISNSCLAFEGQNSGCPFGVGRIDCLACDPIPIRRNARLRSNLLTDQDAAATVEGDTVQAGAIYLPRGIDNRLSVRGYGRLFVIPVAECQLSVRAGLGIEFPDMRSAPRVD